MTRGKLRIYLGAAPGVGKTYAMLAEGQRRRVRGTDVVAALIETHGRMLTAAMTEGLEIVPRRTMTHRGATFTEMDVDAVLARHPQVALVDEFAHSNVPGCRNAKRWQDVDELLDAGIDVITTLNIQHLESLGDVARQVTGVEQQETLPDAVARAADQVELVDMTPEALRRRMLHGNVYPPNRIEAALTHYFRPGNLTALRELALLWVADRVDEGLQRYREEHGIATLWETRERIVVCLAGDASDERVIRRAARIAARIPGSDLLAVHVVCEDGLSPASGTFGLDRQRTLITSLGGGFYQVPGDDIAAALLQFARAQNATQMVLGASRRGRLTTLLVGKSTPTRLARMAEHIDVHLVSQRGLMPGTRVRIVAALRARRTRRAQSRLEASALIRLADAVLGGRGDPPALLEEIREIFELDAVSLLAHATPDTDWYVVASAGELPPEHPGGALDLAVSDSFVLAGRGRTLSPAESRALFSCAMHVVGAVTRRPGWPGARAGQDDETDLATRSALLTAIGRDARQQIAELEQVMATLEAGLGDPQTQRVQLAAMQRTVSNLRRLSANLGELARLHAGAIETYLRPVNFDDVLTAALEDLGPGGRQITLRVADELPDVIADATLLTRTLTSLVADALTQSPDSAPPLLTARAEGNTVEVRITGGGQQDQGNGTSGFALRLAQGLTEAIGATIRREHSPGLDRTVVISLRAAAARNETAAA
jgi:two-component system, OmpR family, sensor histidine kinase KdpD